ncbi:MAG TPA: sigma-70 family RNA polymerase sigma factor [Candidatus Sulfotelmatobacter sp.]
MTIQIKLRKPSHPARLATVRAKIQAAHRANNPALPLETECYTVWHSSARGQPLSFHNFDEAYVERLRQGDFRTVDHFVKYFTALMQIKLRSRLRSAAEIEDVRQETFARVLLALRDNKLRQPERLGPYVNSMCNHVLSEGYRAAQRDGRVEEGDDRDFPDPRVDIFSDLSAKETKKKVRETLDELPERDRRLLRDVFLEEKDKDEVCREWDITRDNLRVLIFRAKERFKVKYLAAGGA